MWSVSTPTARHSWCNSTRGAGFQASALSYTTPNTITDLELVQWDLDSELEIAVMTSAGVTVYDATAGFVSPLSLSAGPLQAGSGFAGTLTALSDDGQAATHLAWASYGSSTLLRVFDSYGLVSSADLNGLDVVALRAADYDGDLDDDVFLTDSASQDVRLLFADTSSGYDFAPSSPHIFHAGGSGDLNPALADFDGDGDVDLVVAANDASGPDEVFVFKGETVDELTTQPQFGPKIGETVATHTLGLVIFSLIEPTDFPSSAFALAPTHIRIKALYQPAIGQLIDLGATQTFDFAADVGNPGVIPAEMDLQELGIVNEVYSLEARLVNINPVWGNVRHAWPATVVTFAVDDDSEQLLLERTGASIAVEVEPLEDPGGNGTFICQPVATQLPPQQPINP